MITQIIKYGLKYFQIATSLFVLVAFCGSCQKQKDWLNEKSDKTQAVPSTLTDYQSLLNNSFTMNYYAPGIGELGSDGHYVSEDAWSVASDPKGINAYTWSHNLPYKIIIDWNQTYSRVFNANLVLDGLSNIYPTNAMDQTTWNNIKGQALFHRADAFFDLAQVWAPPYVETSASKDLSIPLRLNADITIPSVRSTVQQTYDQIISDLRAAADLLPDNNSYRSRPSKTAAFSLLARTFLSIEKYDSALKYADEALQLNSDLLDYNTLDPTLGYIGLMNKEVVFHISLYTGDMSDFLTFNCLIDTTLYNSYDANDLRKTLFFIQNGDGTILFQGNYNNNNTDLFCGLATDELFLIRAECFARAGKTTEAMNDLNTLLQTRWVSGTFIPFTATDSDDALAQVLAERKKELLLRGIRWSDLRRLNHQTNFATTIVRNVGGNSYTLEPNNFRYTFPLPDDVIQLSGMPQNPGW